MLIVSPNKNFRLYYNQTIHPELLRLERQRRRLLRLVFLSGTLLLGSAAILLRLEVLLLALLVSILLGVHISYVGLRIRKFVRTFKPKVVGLILDYIDDSLNFGELSYHADRTVPLDRFLHSGIHPHNPAVYHGEDYISGRIGDVTFELCELQVKEFSPVRERLNLVFRGVFIHARIFHPVKGSVLVLPKRSLPDRSDSVKAYVRKGGRNLDNAIRHEEFRSVFTTYGLPETRLHEALPSELMDFMTAAFHQRGNVFFAIDGHHVYVAVSNDKDTLEPSWLSSNVSFELVREFFQDIETALFVVKAIDRSH
ncbi:MAG: hypothetical protein RLY31_2957 [Bacteroidota bacterium]|jgi:hypothetical protein